MTRTTATKLWAAWAFAGSALEVVTWRWGESGSTLSSHVWTHGHITRRAPFNKRAREICTASFLAWLLIHFISGGRV